MPLQSRPFLLDLPRELRQDILDYVFEDALEKDNRLNEFLRNDLRSCIRFPRLPSVLSAQLDCLRWFQFDPKKIYAPHIHGLATTLTSVHPEIAVDALFIIRCSLTVFDKEQMGIMEQAYLPREDQRRRQQFALEVVEGKAAWYLEVTDLLRTRLNAVFDEGDSLRGPGSRTKARKLMRQLSVTSFQIGRISSRKLE
ncbi:hypothetical protein BLS_008039 [Venturia inaequalis]|uniref:Uncharacterized protein n=1 Tax=Venturia inaequalis TaxID=5025 RepID=A0A8H3VUL3_VENIN|nr:hypothetical protein BLS_008039 [Venturia inaequalis]KAE9994341.1 hypothetical protein EG327_011443 [Venturia inaequalis]